MEQQSFSIQSKYPSVEYERWLRFEINKIAEEMLKNPVIDYSKTLLSLEFKLRELKLMDKYWLRLSDLYFCGEDISKMCGEKDLNFIKNLVTLKGKKGILKEIYEDFSKKWRLGPYGNKNVQKM